MRKTLKQIAELIGGSIVGDADLVITGISGIKEARAGDITFLSNAKYLPFLENTRASAIITSRDISRAAKPIIRTDNPSLAFAKLVSSVAVSLNKHPCGIHPSAVVAKGVRLGKDVSVGAYTVIDEDAVVGDETVIYPQCYIGSQVKIGDHSLIYSNVSLRERVEIGSGVVIQSGAVIGSDGFGFVKLDGKYQRIPQLGIVVVEDNVEIGANVTIDRARFEKTIIGKGTKIDNLVQIGHNVVIGDNSIIVAQVGIAGSARIGQNVTIAGQAGIAGHISVGDGTTVAGQSGVSKSVPENSIVSGYPARPHAVAKRINACVHNLPRLYAAVDELKKKSVDLENRIKVKPAKSAKNKK